MIYFDIEDNGLKTTLSGHINTNLSKSLVDHMLIDKVTQVQADGDELEAILKQINNLPYTTNRVQTWFGDHAKFIAANVKL